MTNAIYVEPDSTESTTIKWNAGGKCFSFDAKTQFIDAVIFTDLMRVLVFHNHSSNESSYVGLVFNLDGENLGRIPFPSSEFASKDIYYVYKWSVETEKGLKLYFGTNSVSYRDFWCDLDLDSLSYTASGEAR